MQALKSCGKAVFLVAGSGSRLVHVPEILLNPCPFAEEPSEGEARALIGPDGLAAKRLCFEMSRVPLPAYAIERATLTLAAPPSFEADGTPSPVHYELRGVQTPWGGGGSPDAVGPLLGTACGTEAGQLVAFDVTSAVRTWINRPDRNYGLSVTRTTEGTMGTDVPKTLFGKAWLTLTTISITAPARLLMISLGARAPALPRDGAANDRHRPG